MSLIKAIHQASVLQIDSKKQDGEVPILSIVIPTRNRARFVRRAIDSILVSPRPDIEVVVIDDGSSDETPFVLREYSDTRFNWRQVESEGNANRARNIGARMSRGSVITFLDSDDAFEATRIERLISFYNMHPNVDCLIDGYGDVKMNRTSLHKLPSVTPPAAEIRHLLLMHCLPLTNSALSVRRVAFEAVGGYDEALLRHQDRELLLRLVVAHTIQFGQETDVIKYRAESSLSHTFDGYVAGLDSLAARCLEYRKAEYANIIRYLAVRGIIKALIQGQLRAAMRETLWLARARNLPEGIFRSLIRYRAGRSERFRASAHAYNARRPEQF